MKNIRLGTIAYIGFIIYFILLATLPWVYSSYLIHWLFGFCYLILMTASFVGLIVFGWRWLSRPSYFKWYDEKPIEKYFY